MGNQKARGVIRCLPTSGGNTVISLYVVSMVLHKRCEYCDIPICGEYGATQCLPTSYGNTVIFLFVVSMVLHAVSRQAVGILWYPYMWWKWCYTLSPDKRWEYCNIPICGEYGATRCLPTSGGNTVMSLYAVGMVLHAVSRQAVGILWYPYMWWVWCYTLSPDKRWEYCDIPIWGEYGATRCLPTSGGNTVISQYVVSMVLHNVSLQAVGILWYPNMWWVLCYTVSPDKRWEYCDIPICGEYCATRCLPTSGGNTVISQYVVSIVLHGVSQQALGILWYPDMWWVWWYTMSPDKLWEYCDIPICGEYGATRCPPKSSGNTVISLYVVSMVLHNVSRQAVGILWYPYMWWVWCYTMSPYKRWEYCDIPICGKYGATQCLPTSGRNTVISLYVVSMVLHNVSRQAVGILWYPYMWWVWCYTMSPYKRWEYCDIPICGEYGATQCLPTSYGNTVIFLNVVSMVLHNIPRQAVGILWYPDIWWVWCYTMSPDKRWEYCDIPICGEYRATRCLPTSYRNTVISLYVVSMVLHNVSLQAVGILWYPYMWWVWCYTMSPDKRWEYCDIPICGEYGATQCLPTSGGNTVMSLYVVSMVLYGVSWQAVGILWYPNMWWVLCYTVSPDKRWEYCDIPICGEYCAIRCLPTSSGNTVISQYVVSMVLHDVPLKALGILWYPHMWWVWCYTMSPDKRWEYCDIPICGEYGATRCLPTSGGNTVISLYVVSMVLHDVSRQAVGILWYPYMWWVWCYTMSPDKRWEYCDIPICGEYGATQCLPTSYGNTVIFLNVVSMVLHNIPRQALGILWYPYMWWVWWYTMSP